MFMGNTTAGYTSSSQRHWTKDIERNHFELQTKSHISISDQNKKIEPEKTNVKSRKTTLKP